jgi:hypothetical protein
MLICQKCQYWGSKAYVKLNSKYQSNCTKFENNLRSKSLLNRLFTLFIFLKELVTNIKLPMGLIVCRTWLLSTGKL